MRIEVGTGLAWAFTLELAAFWAITVHHTMGSFAIAAYFALVVFFLWFFLICHAWHPSWVVLSFLVAIFLNALDGLVTHVTGHIHVLEQTLSHLLVHVGALRDPLVIFVDLLMLRLLGRERPVTMLMVMSVGMFSFMATFFFLCFLGWMGKLGFQLLLLLFLLAHLLNSLFHFLLMFQFLFQFFHFFLALCLFLQLLQFFFFISLRCALLWLSLLFVHLDTRIHRNFACFFHFIHH